MRWVNLTTVDDIYQAQTLGHALGEEGITFIEANENTATLMPYLRQGIQIRVKDTDYQKAKAISDVIEAMRRLRCPKCQSDMIKYQGAEQLPMTNIDIIKKVLHFPATNFVLVYNCLNCNTTFKANG